MLAEFLKINKRSEYGELYGYGSGSGRGSGDGRGNEDGTRDGDEDGDGYGSGSGKGGGKGNEDGLGRGIGSASGGGDGHLCGNGDGSGSGNGGGSQIGEGKGYGDGSGLKSINNHQIYKIDGVNTIIYSIRNNIAKGAILNHDLTLSDCYIVKAENRFSHGKTLKEAQKSLLEKLLILKPIEQRLEEFKNSFPEIDKKYNAKDLYDWHYFLTGSCKMGRDSFVKDNSIDLSKKYSVREFIDYTIDSYKGEIIRQLEKMY